MSPKIYLIAAVLIATFAAGWMTNGWRIKGKAQKETAATLVDLQERMERQVDAMEKFNSKTAAAEAETIASMRKTQIALQGIRDEIGKSNVGSCRITPAGDELRQRTYRSAVPAVPVP